MAITERTFGVELTGAVPVFQLGAIGQGDDNGTTVRLHLTRAGGPASVSGTVDALVITSTGETITLNGSLASGVASVALPSAVLTVPGSAVMAVRLTSGGETKTLAFVEYNCRATSTGRLIDQSGVVPSVAELIAQIQELRAATAEARSVTGSAMLKRTKLTDADDLDTVRDVGIYEVMQSNGMPAGWPARTSGTMIVWERSDYLRGQLVSSIEDGVPALYHRAYHNMTGWAVWTKLADARVTDAVAELVEIVGAKHETQLDRNIYENYASSGTYNVFVPFGFAVGTEYTLRLDVSSAVAQSDSTETISVRTTTRESTSASYAVDTVGSAVGQVSAPIILSYTPSRAASYIRLLLRLKPGEFTARVRVLVQTSGPLDERMDELEDSVEEALEQLQAGGLPGYLADEVDRVAEAVQTGAELDSVSFAHYTDIHYLTVDSPRTAAKDRLCASMRELANRSIIDFTLNGGDWYDGSGTTYAECMAVMRHSAAINANQRVPYFISNGDHDSAQTGTQKVTAADYVKSTMPIMQAGAHIVRPTNANVAAMGAFYWDLPERPGVRTRYVHIPNGREHNYVTELFLWLENEVFTDDVKSGWQFIIACHIPIDIDGLVGRYKATLIKDPTKEGSLYVRRDNLNLGALVNAVNSAGAFAFDVTGSRTVYYSENGVIATSGTAYTYKASGSTATTSQVAKSFAGWTSKVRLIVSGHNHCDRLSNLVGGVRRDYVVAYTANASMIRGDKDSEWFRNAFGTEGIQCSWTDTADDRRVAGTVSEALMDVFTINSSEVRRTRFGCGSDKSCSFN